MQAIDFGAFGASLDQLGWATTPPVLDHEAVSRLRAFVDAVAVEGRGGARNLLAHAPIRALATSPEIRPLAASVLGEDCFAVRAILFDKTPNANWKVVWHQDLTIATRACVSDLPGFGPWSEKAGVPHVQPPIVVLEHMLAVRIHLDPCGDANGPVRVIDGSHRLGRLSATRIDELRQTALERECLVDEGGILAFRPLILHASAPALVPAHRRVIHIEYAAVALPAPLEWHERIA